MAPMEYKPWFIAAMEKVWFHEKCFFDGKR